MGLLDAIGVSSKGLSVQRNKMNVVAKNIANAETTETEQGGPYRRQRVVIKEDKATGTFSSCINAAKVRLASTNPNHISGKNINKTEKAESSSVDMEIVSEPESSFRLVNDPSHPNADENGYVKMPDIEIVNEMVDMMSATRAYEANTVAISSAKKMAKNALEI